MHLPSLPSRPDHNRIVLVSKVWSSPIQSTRQPFNNRISRRHQDNSQKINGSNRNQNQK